MTSSRQAPPPGDAPRSSSYSRFIPREELNSFSAWQPGNIAGGPAPQANVQRGTEEAAKADPSAQHAAEVQAARQAGYHDGYRDGLAALDAFKQSFAAQMTVQVGNLVRALDAELDGLHQEMARTLAVTATHMARRIVRTELRTQPELIAQVAHEAVDTLLLSARHITLRVHPDDQALVAQGAADVLAARGARLLPDPALTRGSCLIESDIGVIDATLEARWRRAAAALGCDEGWGGASPDDDSADPADDMERDA